MSEPVAMWGPRVADARRLWSERVVELVADRVGADVPVVADRLLAARCQQRYLLLGTIARTRRCTVFAAMDQLLAREVALKVHHETDDETTWRLIAEVQAMAGFDHPHVVRVYEAGDHEGWLYTAMELCEADLERWSVGKSWGEVLDRLLEAGRGLAAVHEAGLVHGDVKPENIFVKQGVAKLGDFGLVTTPGWSGRIGGTPGYIAPEVAEGQRGAAGDVFAFACAAWASLVRRPPFGEPPPNADTSAATLVLVERAREREVDEVGGAATAVPRPVLAALRRGLEPKPSDRPPLRELLGQLARLRSAGAMRRRWWALRRGARRGHAATRTDEATR